MKFADAVAIVRDLANENVLEEWMAEENGIPDAREEQLEAVKQIDLFLDLLRGHHL
jgi:hypothetical protein